VIHVAEHEKEDNLFHCRCCGMVRNGYPCIHQLVILRHISRLPGIEYFNTRWLAQTDPGNAGGGSIWTQDDMASDDDIHTVNHEDGTEQSLAEVHD
jgi:hypothetical protein